MNGWSATKSDPIVSEYDSKRIAKNRMKYVWFDLYSYRFGSNGDVKTFWDYTVHTLHLTKLIIIKMYQN